jgi:hypothetical protein
MSIAKPPSSEDSSPDAIVNPKTDASSILPTDRRPPKWLILFKPKVGIPLAILLVLATIPLAYRSWRISSLPQIDEPFDVEAFCSVTIPDEENAFVEYREAFDLFVEFPGKNKDWESYNELVNGNWDKPLPAFVAWIRNNNLAFDTWLSGTPKPNALFMPRRDVTYAAVDYTDKARSLTRIAMLRAGRHLVDGNTDEAWEILHAAFRFSRHVGQHGVVVERQTGAAILPLVCGGLLAWAHHANTTAEDIEHAILVLSEEFPSMTLPYSVTLKHEYLAAQNCLKDLDESYWVFDSSPVIDSALIFVLGEPEYSMVLLDLVLANQLAGIDVAPPVRPPFILADDRLFDIPAVPRKHVSGVELAELLDAVSAIEAVSTIPWIRHAFTRMKIERTFASTMISVLSIESYVRKHGQFPLSLDAFTQALPKRLFADPNIENSALLTYRSNDEFAVVYSLGADGVDDRHPVDPSDESSRTSTHRLGNSNGSFEGYRIPLWRPTAEVQPDENNSAVVPDNVQD